MRVVMFCQSLVSDHGNDAAHFVRGLAAELLHRGHEALVYEPRDGWSRAALVRAHGEGPIEAFYRAHPGLASRSYDLQTLDMTEALYGADVVLVHRPCEAPLVAALAGHRRSHDYLLFFHDTHHTAPHESDRPRLDVAGFDAVLAGACPRVLSAEPERVFAWPEGPTPAERSASAQCVDQLVELVARLAGSCGVEAVA